MKSQYLFAGVCIVLLSTNNLFGQYVNKDSVILPIRIDSVPVKSIVNKLKSDGSGLINNYRNAIPRINAPDFKTNKIYKSYGMLSENLKVASGNISHNFIDIQSLLADYSFQLQPAYYDPLVSNNSGHILTTSLGMSVVNVPVEVFYQVSYQPATFGEVMQNVSFRYERENYLTKLTKQMAGKFDPSELIPNEEDMMKEAKDKFSSGLRKEVADLQSQYNGLLDDKIAELGDFKELLALNPNIIRQKLLSSDYLKQIRSKQASLEQLQSKINAGYKVDNEQMNDIKNELARYKGIEEFLQRIEKQKTNADLGSLYQKIKKNDLLRKERIQQLLKDPAAVTDLAKKYLNLNSFQKLMLKVNKLSIGQQAISLSPLSMQNYLGKGVSTQFISKKSFLMLAAGRSANNNNFNALPLENNYFDNENNFKSIRFGKGDLQSTHAHITLSSFKETNKGTNYWNRNQSGTNTSVITFSNRVNLGKQGSIQGEISKSAMKYESMGNPLDSFRRNNSSISKLINDEYFSKSLAMSLRYQDNLPAIGLSHSVYVNKIANGYYNPGNIYLPRGVFETGASIRKSLFKQKMYLMSRGDYREYNFTEHGNQKWKNINFMLDARWLLAKGQYAGIRYQPLRSIRIDDKTRRVISATDRFSADVNYVHRFSRIYYRNYLSVTYQKNEYANYDSSLNSNKSILFNSFQNITLGSHIIYANISYNHALSNKSDYVYFNSSFNGDLGYTYSINRFINASSALAYSVVDGWYSDAGIKQTLSGQLSDRLFISLYLDARYRIRQYQEVYQDPIRADFNIQYILK